MYAVDKASLANKSVNQRTEYGVPFISWLWNICGKFYAWFFTNT